MAIDSYLFNRHAQAHAPTLRFYGWAPPAISLGYHQRRYPEFWEQLHWQGQPIDLVRRPSGGRAVLHQGDLTYAVVTSGLANSRMQAYRQICEFLIQGWRSLGVELSYGEAGRGYIHQPNCFAMATAADLVTAEGAKLIGSAQLRQGNAILQHGSMQLAPDFDLFQQVFQTEDNPAALPQLSLKTGPIAGLDIAGLDIKDLTSLIDALTRSAETCFGMQLLPQPLDAAEWQVILTDYLPKFRVDGSR